MLRARRPERPARHVCGPSCTHVRQFSAESDSHFKQLHSDLNNDVGVCGVYSGDHAVYHAVAEAQTGGQFNRLKDGVEGQTTDEYKVAFFFFLFLVFGLILLLPSSPSSFVLVLPVSASSFILLLPSSLHTDGDERHDHSCRAPLFIFCITWGAWRVRSYLRSHALGPPFCILYDKVCLHSSLLLLPYYSLFRLLPFSLCFFLILPPSYSSSFFALERR
jgi:hypothetical protein